MEQTNDNQQRQQTINQRNNPFVNSDGELINPYLDYQRLINSETLAPTLKNFMAQATGQQTTPLANSSRTSLANSSRTSRNTNNYLDRSRTSRANSTLNTSRTRQAANNQVNFNGNLDSNSLVSLDVINELPKLSTDQISAIISNHFSNSSVIKPSDAEGIYKAQQSTGMSALAILGIGALESGYGTSALAKQKNNLWGWGAYNSDPLGNGATFSPISEGATQFANNFLSTYYNKYGAKSIYSAGTGNNPAKKGYSYRSDGSIETEWASKVGGIMGTFYNTAKSVYSSKQNSSNLNSSSSKIVNAAQKYLGTPYVWGGESMAEGGMDCSGFVYNALKDAGYKVGRTTAQGYRAFGKTVSKSQMQPGDIIFYGSNKNDASHIAIYIGNGQMIHSSGGSKNTKSKPGKGVSIANVDYRSDFIEARRY